MYSIIFFYKLLSKIFKNIIKEVGWVFILENDDGLILMSFYSK